MQRDDILDISKEVKATTGRQKVGSYSTSRWLAQSETFEARGAILYDLETEVETIQEHVAELLESMTTHWLIRGVMTGLLTFEWWDLVYLKIQLDWKAI